MRGELFCFTHTNSECLELAAKCGVEGDMNETIKRHLDRYMNVQEIVG